MLCLEWGILNNKEGKGGIFIIKKFIPIIALLVLIGGGIFVYVTSNNPTIIEVSLPNEEGSIVPSQSIEESDNTNLATIDQEQLRETLNLSLRVISAMLHTNYEYLEGVSDPSVSLDKDNHSITFGEIDYESPLMTGFDYDNFEFRGYMVEGDSIYIILGVHNISYEFKFVKGKSKYGNYLWKSLLTN